MPRSDERRVSAQVGAAPHFADCLLAVHAFMVAQDTASAPARLAQLKRDLREMKTMLAWSPASGRPARFLKPNSAQASLRLAGVQQLQTGCRDSRVRGNDGACTAMTRHGPPRCQAAHPHSWPA